jgi:hypothetical protein
MRTATNDGRGDRGNLRKMLCPVSRPDFKSLLASLRRMAQAKFRCFGLLPVEVQHNLGTQFGT